jgi:hypothetical protein
VECIICNSLSNYYFSKTYLEHPFNEFMKEIGKVDYYKCQNCGFVLSKTHSELDEKEWNELNKHFHHYMENDNNGRKSNQPPYSEQAMMLLILSKNGIIRTDSMIDYAAGYGTLSNILVKYYDLELPIFDRYIQANNADKYISEKKLETYKTVINSAMFEHILRREDLDSVNNIVEDDGCLIIHTVVCENVPNDPDWFYLRPPVHTAFHTNKSMEILMNQWNYHSSIYCPQSKCWILLKDDIKNIENKIATMNRELQSNWFFWKKGFVDYWKGF